MIGRLHLHLLTAASACLLLSGCGEGLPVHSSRDASLPADAGTPPGADASTPAGPDAGEPVDVDEDTWAAPEDCDDADPDVHPGADELCNGKDDDCDGATDEEATDALSYYQDADSDTFGSPATEVKACAPPAGMVAAGGDCDDTDDTIHPGVEEVCNLFDDDCDGTTDEEAADAVIYYRDQDHDTFGDENAILSSCAVSPPNGYADRAEDCDDQDGEVNPGADELCNGKDDDCEGTTDANASDAQDWYLDRDADTWGDSASGQRSCAAVDGRTQRGGDCDDFDPDVHPGAEDLPDGAPDDPDGVDANCDGMDGDKQASVFVAPPGTCGCSDAGAEAGTYLQPYCSLALAVQAAAAATSPAPLLVANGVFSLDAPLSLVPGTRMYGGFNCSQNWSRDVRYAATTLAAAPALPYAVIADTLDSGEAVLDHLTIIGPDKTGQVSVGSIAMVVKDTPAQGRLTLSGCVVRAGAGGDGTDGSAGEASCTRAAGGKGGQAPYCEHRSPDGVKGGDVMDGSTVLAAGGAGGTGGLSQCKYGDDAICPLRGFGYVEQGGPGGNGVSGSNAARVAQAHQPKIGTIGQDGTWSSAPGEDGAAGGNGAGGGGGGAGGSKDIECTGYSGTCGYYPYNHEGYVFLPGGSGGDGGHGGCGGSGGTAGGPGGASLALVLVHSRVMLTNLTSFERGIAGRGGDGGRGAFGEQGFAGQDEGYAALQYCGPSMDDYYSHHGGPGGNGGDGGGGSGGSGGHGGPAVCIARDISSSVDTLAPLSCTGGAGGHGGAGGQGGYQGNDAQKPQAPGGEPGTDGVLEVERTF